MVEKLKKLLESSYCPYSKFAVSAIVVMRDGKEFGGVNVENASYGATICAERNAITSAITAGYQKGDFKEINIMVSSGNISTCCFLCRQVITEFFEKSATVNCYSKSGKVKKFTVGDMCPYPFDGSDLE